MKTCHRVLPWWGLPHHQGFWGRILGTATADASLGLHPALHPQSFVGGIATKAIPPVSTVEDLEVRLPAPKTESGIGAQRRNLQASKVAENFPLPLKSHLRASLRGALKRLPFKEPVSGTLRATLKPLKREMNGHRLLQLPMCPRGDICSEAIPLGVNQEGGLCNTPLYNYLGVGQRNDI